MYCQACGADNTADARFCNMCGSRFAQVGETGGPLGADTDPDAPIPTGGPRNDPNATVLGVGKAAMAGGAPVIHAPTAPAAPGGGVPTGGMSPFGGDSMLGVTLGGIGVKSAKKTWLTIFLIAAALVAAGSLATWLAMGRGEETAGHAEPDDPFVLGTPLTEETEGVPDEVASGDPTPEDIDFVTGAGGSSSSASSTMGTSRRRRSTSSGSGSSSAGTMSTGSSSTGSSGSGSSGSGASMGTSGSSGSGGSTAMNDTGSMTAGGGTTEPSMDTGSGGTSTMDSGGGSLPDISNEPQERDLELELYGSRVRYVVRRYYAARAQSCFDRATRNDPTISGTVVVAMTIGADGEVGRTRVQRNTTGNDTLGTCLSSQVATWRLPPPPGGSLDMTMPFSR